MIRKIRIVVTNQFNQEIAGEARQLDIRGDSENRFVLMAWLEGFDGPLLDGKTIEGDFETVLETLSAMVKAAIDSSERHVRGAEIKFTK